MQDNNKKNPAADLFMTVLSASHRRSNGELIRQCPYCKREIQPATIKHPFKDELVQVPVVCKCEAEAEEKERQAAADLQRKKEIDRMFGMFRAGERFKDDTFNSFTFRPGSEVAAKAASKYASSFDPKASGGLCLWGSPGNGKTKLAMAITNCVSGKGYSVVFIKTTDLLEKIRSTFGRGNGEDEAQIMRALRLCDLLVLDDVGAEHVTDWVLDVLFRVIDGRYVDKKPIVLTSNIAASKLDEKIGQRIQDRIFEMCEIVKNEATSYRRELAEKRSRGE